MVHPGAHKNERGHAERSLAQMDTGIRQGVGCKTHVKRDNASVPMHGRLSSRNAVKISQMRRFTLRTWTFEKTYWSQHPNVARYLVSLF